MKNNLSKTENLDSKQEDRITTEYYLQSLDPEILNSFSPEQLTAVRALLKSTNLNPSPKIVDLRFTVDLIVARYYFVLLAGRDRRSKDRTYTPNQASRIGNMLSILVILIGFNLLITMTIILGSYLVKSFIGINFMPGHFSQTVEKNIGK